MILMLVIRQGMFDTMAISFDSSRRCLYVPNPTSVRLFIMSIQGALLSR